MSNKRKFSNPVIKPQVVENDPTLTPEMLDHYLNQQRPEHPDWEVIAAAVKRNDRLIEEEGHSSSEVVQDFCDPSSLIYVATQRAMRITTEPEVVKTLAACFLDGFMAACVAQDRLIIDINPTEYEEYERDQDARQELFEKFRANDMDIMEFNVERRLDDGKTFSKGALEWLHDQLWLFIAARIAAHWDREGDACTRLKVNAQLITE